ncbi:hypothetical protein E2562_038429, partial [Oryza meyeriana var. granulata]
MTSQQLSYCCFLIILLKSFLSCSAATTGKVPAVIVFGDSTVDAGNNNDIPTAFKANFPPYGRDFDGGVATGRFSNGRLVTDFLSEALGLPSSVPAYLDSSYTIDQLACGVSFASAGAGLDDLTAQIAFNVVIKLQKGRQHRFQAPVRDTTKSTAGVLQGIQGEAKARQGREYVTNEIITEALYIFSIGTNDFIINYFLLPLRPAVHSTSEYVAYLIGLADVAVRDAYELGTRKILFVGLTPLGCLPSARTLNIEAPAGECNEEHNKAALAFNGGLKKAMRKLNDKLAGARVAYSDIYGVVSSILSNPSDY